MLTLLPTPANENSIRGPKLKLLNQNKKCLFKFYLNRLRKNVQKQLNKQHFFLIFKNRNFSLRNKGTGTDHKDTVGA